MHNPWTKLSFDAWSLSIEAAGVMGLRTLKLAAGGPAGVAESQLMVTEKVGALFDLQMLALTGGLGTSPTTAARRTIKHYRRKVRANQRRLG